MNAFWRRAVVAPMVLLSSQWCAIALGAPDAALTLREALELANRHNPTLLAFAPDREARQQESLIQAMSPATTVEAQFENFAGTGDASNTRLLETTLQLSHVIELGGKAAARRDFGASSLERLDATQRAKRADLLAEVARRFVHVLSDQEDLAATVRATDLAQRARDAVRERINTGATSQIFLGRAEISLARARIEQEHAEHELASSRVVLASLWGDTQPAFTDAPGNSPATPGP